MKVLETISLSDITAAAARIAPYIQATPLLQSPLLNKRLGFQLLLKAENVQFTGSFKVRGAFNHMVQLTDEERRRGVIALSSGNHAQAVAYAAATFGVRANIVMPQDAPALKLANTRAYGADIVTYDRATEDREAIGRGLAEKHNLVLIHPYDALRTIAGQGTIGLEIFHQTRALKLAPDAIIVNCGGGGLSAGIAVTRALYDHPPQIYTAEPADFNDAQRSLLTGTHVENIKRGGSICDALLSPKLGYANIDILRRERATGFSATDAEVEAAMDVAMEYFKQVLEPGGAVSLACALNQAQDFQGKTVVVVASGGNVDPTEYTAMLTRGQWVQKTFWPMLHS